MMSETAQIMFIVFVTVSSIWVHTGMHSRSARPSSIGAILLGLPDGSIVLVMVTSPYPQKDSVALVGVHSMMARLCIESKHNPKVPRCSTCKYVVIMIDQLEDTFEVECYSPKRLGYHTLPDPELRHLCKGYEKGHITEGGRYDSEEVRVVVTPIIGIRGISGYTGGPAPEEWQE